MAETMQTTDDGDLIGAVFEDQLTAQKVVMELARYHIEDVVLHNQYGPTSLGMTADIADRTISDVVLCGPPRNLKRSAGPLRRFTLLGIDCEKAYRYLDQLLEGRILVTANNVQLDQRAIVIDTFNKFGGLINPDGSRNVREDVVGMTTGSAIGAAAGAVIGGITGGPLGSAAGGAAGAVAGGAMGAVAGQAAEHQN